MEDLQSPAADPYEALIHCTPTRRDQSGNTYWFASFTNPATGKSLTAEVYAPGNAPSLVSRAIYGSVETKYGVRPVKSANSYRTEGEPMPIRYWQRQRKDLIAAKMYEGAPELIEALRKLLA